MATDLLQAQINKTGELLTQSVQDAEKLAVNAAEEAKHEAIDAFDAEVAKVEKVVDTSVNQAATAIDTTIKGADEFLDQKRGEVVDVVNTTKKQTEDSMQDASTQLLGKARGLLNCKTPHHFSIKLANNIIFT
ncbi:hypothetical protein Phum_PHUM011760 [Pediculus humanus corporis]|uniref:Uncharacterized protein n=1 Tax=Pediculus humanus subsp. corporis TaxID=121224 RepID=E0V9H1_PEDHC|nr:uncharacterized protein Phum_PHUM011760 [Pediculus humanus corporis]EEB10027.1 hypothetical protein Phum_PHUM011760 [Pediculus humanus corporis]